MGFSKMPCELNLVKHFPATRAYMSSNAFYNIYLREIVKSTFLLEMLFRL